MNDSLSDIFWKMRHGLLRSYYYYESRRCFWMLFFTVTKTLEFCVGYPAIADLVNGKTGCWLWIRSIVAVLSFGLTLFKASQRIKTLGSQMRAMRECLAMMPYREKDETEKRYKAIKEKREKAERKDDVVFEVLDAMCYNKACKTLGANERCKLTGIQKFFGWWLPLPYTTNAQIEDSMSEVSHETTSPPQKIFYDGEVFDAKVFATKHILSARKSILLIDNWIDVTTLEMLAKKRSGVTIEIVSSPRGNHIAPSDITAFNTQYSGLTVRTSTAFHDRFLIIDDTHLYLFGASLKDLGKKCFAFTKMAASEIANLKARI